MGLLVSVNSRSSTVGKRTAFGVSAEPVFPAVPAVVIVDWALVSSIEFAARTVAFAVVMPVWRTILSSMPIPLALSGLKMACSDCQRIERPAWQSHSLRMRLYISAEKMPVGDGSWRGDGLVGEAGA